MLLDGRLQFISRSQSDMTLKIQKRHLYTLLFLVAASNTVKKISRLLNTNLNVWLVGRLVHRFTTTDLFCDSSCLLLCSASRSDQAGKSLLSSKSLWMTLKEGKAISPSGWTWSGRLSNRSSDIPRYAVKGTRR